jgi:hypothetical protein
VVVSKHLNPMHVKHPPPSTTINDDSLWGVVVSIKKTNISFVKFKLSLHHRIPMDDDGVKSLV